MRPYCCFTEPLHVSSPFWKTEHDSLSILIIKLLQAVLVPIGTRVKFKHSPDEGVIIRNLDSGLLEVRLDDSDITIPIAADALIFPERKKKGSRAKKKPDLSNTPLSHSGEQRPRVDPSISPTDPLKDFGLLLAFDPVLRDDASIEKYAVMLLNGTGQDILASLDFWLGSEQCDQKHARIVDRGYKKLTSLYYDELNDGPEFHIDCRPITDKGTGKRHFKKIRLKPKQFFTRVNNAPLLDRKAHIYPVFEELGRSIPLPQKREDLRKYTQRRVRPTVKPGHELSQHEVVELASFNAELDLHIEKLIVDTSELQVGDIIKLQIDAFERYIDKAVQLGLERVFIIHGVGKGTLRKAIANRLLAYPHVDTFKNEYHPRYGWGATEVIFG